MGESETYDGGRRYGSTGHSEANQYSKRVFKMNEGYIITIDLTSSKPIYRQIADNVITQIAMGVLVPGDKLPSSRQLSTILGINYHTVNRAYSYLVQEGYVYLDRRKKVFVSDIPEGKREKLNSEWVGKIRTLLSEALSKGYDRAYIIDEIESILAEINLGK